MAPERALRRSPLGLLLPVLLALSLAACGQRPIGHGVVLWAEKEGAFRTGERVQVMKESTIQKAYYVRQEGSETLVEIPMWRLRFFPEMEEAQTFEEAYAGRLSDYGYAMRSGLPIREAADDRSGKIYLLREGQLVKVLGRGESPVTVGSYNNYWYQVLTEDGYAGWCYGQYLRTFTAAADPAAEAARLMSQDPVLDRLLATVWRPEFFVEMIGRGRLDLDRFRTDVGLFPEPEQRRVRLVMPRYSFDFDYLGIEKVGPGRYTFTGTELRISMAGENRIAISYPVGGRLVSGTFYLVEEDIEEVIAQELERRARTYENIAARGRLLASTAYGNIRLEDEMRFQWNGLGSLASRLALRSTQAAGRIDFPYDLSREMRGQYGGVITFHFDGQPEGASFLYTLENEGIRLVLLRPGDVVDGQAIRTDLAPLILYFTFAEG